MLGACAVCERPQPVPIQRIAFYPERATAYYPVTAMAPTRVAASIQHADGRADETTLGEAKTLSGTARDPMAMCLKSWDEDTHIRHERWREICARTQGKPHT